MNYFEILNSINVGDKTEKKNGLTYLSWAFAWAELKKKYPRSFYTIYENDKGWFYHTDGKTAWVKTGVTVNASTGQDSSIGECLEHIEYLPVMDFRNASIPADKVTSFDVNKAIQRSLTKAVARHGLGLYIYAGEDLPEAESEPEVKGVPVEKAKIDKFVQDKTPAKVSADCGEEEYQRRRGIIASLIKTMKKTNADYTKDANGADLKTMTLQEFVQLERDLTNKWLAS